MLDARKLSSLILILALAIPKRASAQDLTSKSGGVSQSLHTLLAKMPSLPAVPVQTSSKLGLSSDSTPFSTHEKFATFLAGEDFNSTLLLENFRPDLPITFNP